jgi:L-serine/L-threonine ammonia-lyase
VSFVAQKCFERHGRNAHLIIASGGNAGLACACAASDLGIQCTVYIPEGNLPTIINRLRAEGAQVVVAGTNFRDANELAKAKAATDLARWVLSARIIFGNMSC